jgi:hypothetical protein
VKLLIDPTPPLPILLEDLQLVIEVVPSGIPSIYVEEGRPPADRHLLLGIGQSVVISVEERDAESVALMEQCSVKLMRQGEMRDLAPGLTIVRTNTGRIGALAVGDAQNARRLARETARYFSRILRLDVP